MIRCCINTFKYNTRMRLAEAEGVVYYLSYSDPCASNTNDIFPYIHLRWCTIGIVSDLLRFLITTPIVSNP